MKVMSFLVVSSSLFLLAACNDKPNNDPSLETSFDPQVCTSKSMRACGVDWHLLFNADNFPKDAQVLINDKIMIDDCDPQSYWSRLRNSKDVEYTIHDYASLKGTEKLSVRVFDRLGCIDNAKTEYLYKASIKPVIKTLDGVNQVVIDLE